MPISLVLIQEATNSLFRSVKAERGGGAADKTWVQSPASCPGPGPSETNKRRGWECS